MRKLLSSVIVLVAAGSASAVLNFNLTTNSGTFTTAGGTLTLVGTVTGLTADVTVANSSFTAASPLTITPDPAFLAYLNMNTLADYSGNIATVTVPAGTPVGFYDGQTDQVVVGSAVDNDNELFAVTVTPVPEPASMVALGVGAVALVRRRRKA